MLSVARVYVIALPKIAGDEMEKRLIEKVKGVMGSDAGDARNTTLPEMQRAIETVDAQRMDAYRAGGRCITGERLALTMDLDSFRGRWPWNPEEERRSAGPRGRAQAEAVAALIWTRGR
jgi:hypothetical protein